MEIWQRRRCATVIVSVLLASPALLISLPIGAAAETTAKDGCPAATRKVEPGAREFLFFNVCGPRDVTRGRYSYTVVLTNAGRVSSGQVKLSVFHADPIARSSIPYRESPGVVDFGMHEAGWTVGNLAPGRSFRVTITVSFRRHKQNSAFTELVLKAAGQHPGAGGGAKKDVFFK